MSVLCEHATVRFEFQRRTRNARHDQQAARSGGQHRDLARGAAVAGRHDRDRADLALYAGSGAAGAGDEFRQRHLGRADDGVALHGRHRAVAADHGSAVGQVRTAPGAARRADADGGGQHRLHLRAILAATDRGAFLPGAGRRRRHGGQPRHHPRYLRARSRRLDDQPRGRGADDRADGLAPHRRPDRDRVRLARDLLRHHDRRDPRRRGHRGCPAGDTPHRAAAAAFAATSAFSFATAPSSVT